MVDPQALMEEAVEAHERREDEGYFVIVNGRLEWQPGREEGCKKYEEEEGGF